MLDAVIFRRGVQIAMLLQQQDELEQEPEDLIGKDNLTKNDLDEGQKVTVTYEGREFEVIVIDPNGLGEGQPSLGFGLTMMDKHAGLP